MLLLCSKNRIFRKQLDCERCILSSSKILLPQLVPSIRESRVLSLSFPFPSRTQFAGRHRYYRTRKADLVDGKCDRLT